MTKEFYIEKIDSEFHIDDPHAPVRRAFYVNVGDIPVEVAASYLEKVKQEISNRDR